MGVSQYDGVSRVCSHSIEIYIIVKGNLFAAKLALNVYATFLTKIA